VSATRENIYVGTVDVIHRELLRKTFSHQNRGEPLARALRSCSDKVLYVKNKNVSYFDRNLAKERTLR
jgi:hypothetical protein